METITNAYAGFRRLHWALQTIILLVIISVTANLIDSRPKPQPQPAPQFVQAPVSPNPVVQSSRPSAPTISASVVYADVTDSSAKTQIELRAVLSTPLEQVSASEIESFLRGVFAEKPRWDSYMTVDRILQKRMLAELEQSFGDLSWLNSAKTIKRSSNRQSLTHFYVMLYASQNDAQSVSGWVGRLAWQVGTEPEVLVREERLREAQTPDTKIGGLTREQRMAVFKQITPCGSEGFRKAEERYPDNLNKQAAYSSKVTSDCMKKIAKQHGLTLQQLETLNEEGLNNSWPMYNN